MSGCVLIFNHENFTNEEEQRLGTEHDVLALKNLFEKFNIYHQFYTDLTFYQIATEVERLKTCDFTKYSYLAVFILTHGDVDNNLSAKDQKYNFNLNLVDPIVDNNRTLDDKPKIFIVQACKGKNEHRYLAVDANSTSKSKITTPSKSNMCFIYSTFEGYVSERDPRFGGQFIQSLCKHIDEYGTRDTIEAIMRSVTKELTQNIYQVPMFISTLTEPFFFCEKPVHEPIARSIEFREFGIRGYAIIFDNNTFEINESEHLATEPDVLALKNVFEQFNVSYEIYTDFTFNQISTEVERLKKLDFKDYSYLAVFILTNGDNNILYAKDQKYNLFDLIINPIVDNNNSLAEKPKIFFVQASKGNSHHFYERNVDAAVGKSIIAVPSKKNTCIAFSTYEGFISKQNPIIGGPFIQSLCKNIIEYGSTDSIEAIMRRVSKELVENIQQVPTIFSTLSEDFFFGEKNLFNVIKANQPLPREPTVNVDENNDEIIKLLEIQIAERKKFLEKQLKIQKENEKIIQHSTIPNIPIYSQIPSNQNPNDVPIGNNNSTKIISQLEYGITNLKGLVYEIQKNKDPQFKNDFMQQIQEINSFLLKHQNDIDSLKIQTLSLTQEPQQTIS